MVELSAFILTMTSVVNNGESWPGSTLNGSRRLRVGELVSIKLAPDLDFGAEAIKVGEYVERFRGGERVREVNVFKVVSEASPKQTIYQKGEEVGLPAGSPLVEPIRGNSRR